MRLISSIGNTDGGNYARRQFWNENNCWRSFYWETEEVSSEKEQKEIDINDKTISLTIIKLVEEKKLSIEKYGNLIEILLNDYTNRTFSKEEAAILNAIPIKGLKKAVA